MTGFFCCTSTRTAVGDGLLDLVRYSSSKDDLAIIKGEPYADSEFAIPSDRILTLPFSKSDIRTYTHPGSWRKFGRFLREHEVDRLLIYSTVPVNWAASRFLGRNRVHYWVHDPVPHPGEPLLKRWIQNQDRKILMKSNRIASVLVGSRYLRGLVVDLTGLDAELVHAIPLPWQSEIVRRGRWIEWDERKYDLIFWGRIEAYKGLEVFSAALERLYSEGRELKVVIAGSGAMADYLSPAIMRSGNVRIDNRYIPDEELGLMISDSRIAVFPYTSSTGTMIAQTALALGCRVIASEVGSFSEYVTVDGERLGLLVPPGDAGILAATIGSAVEEEWDAARSRDLAGRFFSPEKWVAAIELIMQSHSSERSEQ